MPRVLNIAPPEVQKACHEGLEDLIGCTDIVEEYVLPTYVIGLKECSAGGKNGPGYEQPTGWKFVVADSAGRAFMADLMPDADGKAEVISASESEYAQKILAGVRDIDNLVSHTLPDSMPTYDLRWLSIPSILVEGLWLHSVDDSQSSWMHPLLNLPKELQSIPLYLFDDLMRIISKLGLKREAVDDSPIYL